MWLAGVASVAAGDRPRTAGGGTKKTAGGEKKVDIPRQKSGKAWGSLRVARDHTTKQPHAHKASLLLPLPHPNVEADHAILVA